MADIPRHLELDADPADNPNQPPEDQQGEHHPGSHKQAAKMRVLLRKESPKVRALAALVHGDVVFDYSSAKPTNAQFVAAKCVGVSRYLSPLNADGSDYGPTLVKVIQSPEYKWHLDNSRIVFKNYEWYETRMDESAAAGTQDAYWAGTKAWKLEQAVGVDPATKWWARWITFSNDKDGTPYAVVKAYMLAAYAQLQKMPGKYLPNYYGRQVIWNQLLHDPDIHWLPWGWQTCAWSGGVYGGNAGLYQAICAPVSPNIPGCDTNFIMKTLGDDTAPVIGEEAMIIVHAPTGGIGTLSAHGVHHLNGAEWNAISTIKSKLPAAVRETLMPWVEISDAQWNALTPDAIQDMFGLIYRGDTDANGQAKPPGQNTHPANIEFIYNGVTAAVKATDTVETTQTAMMTAIAALPKEIPPLTDAQLTAIAQALSQIHPEQTNLTVTLEGTAKAQAPPAPVTVAQDYADSAE